MLCWGLSTDVVALLGRGGTKEAENFPSSGAGDRGAEGIRRESLPPHFFFSCFSRSYKNSPGVLLGSSAPQTLKYCMKGCLRWYHAYHPYVELGLKWLFFAYSRWDQTDYLKKKKIPTYQSFALLKTLKDPEEELIYWPFHDAQRFHPAYFTCPVFFKLDLFQCFHHIRLNLTTLPGRAPLYNAGRLGYSSDLKWHRRWGKENK